MEIEKKRNCSRKSKKNVYNTIQTKLLKHKNLN